VSFVPNRQELLYLDRSNHQFAEDAVSREEALEGKLRKEDKVCRLETLHLVRGFLTGLGLCIPACRKIPGPGSPGTTDSHDPPLRKIDDILSCLQRADDTTDRKPNGKAGSPTSL
jgi:hypothetical protein